jgi:zinc protease
VNVNDLKNFFLRRYGPNNAVLTVGGDVTAAQAVQLAEKYFGTIPKGPAVTKTTVPPAILDKNHCQLPASGVKRASEIDKSGYNAGV